LPPQDIAAFAYGCARRTSQLAEDQPLALAIENALGCLRGAILGSTSADDVRAKLSELGSFAIDSDAHASASYALRAYLTGLPQEAAWAARRAYEARGTLETDQSADVRASIQTELEAQASDLAAVLRGKYLDI